MVMALSFMVMTMITTLSLVSVYDLHTRATTKARMDY